MSLTQAWSTFVLDYQSSVNLPVLVGSLTLFVSYWSFGLIHLYLDITRRPPSLYDYKIQKTMHFNWSAEKPNENPPGRRLLANLLFSMILVVPFTLWIMDRGILLVEVFFFYAHWVLHTPFLYRRVHKVHHEFKSPIALAALYAHPVEVAFGNVFAVMGPSMLLGLNLFTWLLFVAVGILGTQSHHCGYRFPWFPAWDIQPNFHDFHHKVFKGNYGLLGWLDRLHGTDALWQAEVGKTK